MSFSNLGLIGDCLVISFYAFSVLKVIDGIMSIGDKFLSNKSTTSKRKLEALVHNVLDFLCKSSDKQGKAKALQMASDGGILKQAHFVV